MKGSILASEIDLYNKMHKKEQELRKCLKCIHFDKKVYQCKEKKCKK